MSHRRFKNKSQCSPGYTKYFQFTFVIPNHFPYIHITQTFLWKISMKLNNPYVTGTLLLISCSVYSKTNLPIITPMVGLNSLGWSLPTQKNFWLVSFFSIHLKKGYSYPSPCFLPYLRPL